MLGFDIFLHLQQILTKTYLVIFPSRLVYDLFWASYWGIFLILLIFTTKKSAERKQKKKDGGN